VNVQKILVVDDHPLVLRGIRQVLESAEDFRVVGESTSGSEALELMGKVRPDIIVLDLRLPDLLGPDVCREMLARTPSLKVVILTAFDDPKILWACVEAGAAGILLKGSLELDLVRALRDVSAGCMVMDKTVSQVLHNANLLVKNDHGNVYGGLRSREYDVLRLLAQGMSTREIGTALGLRTNTVRSYTQSLMEKLQAHNRVQLVVVANRLHLI
jgi:DNA-binding NarL/FixJ family response regulator